MSAMSNENDAVQHVTDASDRNTRIDLLQGATIVARQTLRLRFRLGWNFWGSAGATIIQPATVFTEFQQRLIPFCLLRCPSKGGRGRAGGLQSPATACLRITTAC